MRRLELTFAAALLAACGGEDAPPPPVEPPPTTIGTCTFEPLVPTARTGETVTAGAVSVGTAETILDMPVGSALGAYTSRLSVFGSSGRPDDRAPLFSGAFVPSAGVETLPRAKAMALSAGGETVVIIHLDLGVTFDGVLFEVEQRLGADFAGKVMLTASHTHGGPAHFVGNSVLQLGFAAFREQAFSAVVETAVAVAEDALAALEPATVGIAHDPNFDPEDRVSRDRRDANDDLPGGADRKDHDLYVLRADRLDGSPLAVVPIFGVHPTVLGGDNNLATTDAAGAIERAVEETFDEPVLVMHLQQAAGDVSPAGSGGIDCGEDSEFCYSFARSESVGRAARDAILAAWEQAGEGAQSELELEMLTRSIPLGPDLTTISARDGALTYLPYEEGRQPDGVIFDGDGEVASPIDEFNTPFGAGLCGGTSRLGVGMVGVNDLAPYTGCSRIDEAVSILEFGVGDDWYFEDPLPSCATTATTLSALRIGEHLFVSLPGEPLNPYVDRLRDLAPTAPDKVIALGYAQDHVGYLLHADDWLRAGYEPGINIWGPIEGEYILESAVELAELALTPERENGAEGFGRPLPMPFSPAPGPEATPDAGTVPSSLPSELYLRPEVTLSQAQPPATVPRLGLAHFVWIGEDPLAGTPRVTLEREEEGSFVPVRRRSGRPVIDQDLLLFWTPVPLEAEADRTHYWVVEWQAAVPWGTEGLDEVADRAGLPLGRYRFAIEGTGYSLTSEPFEVVPATLDVAATRNGDVVDLDVAYLSPQGFRLLDLEARSNRRVPLRVGPLSAEVRRDDDSTEAIEVTIADGLGQLTIPAGNPVVDVVLTDRFGNTATIVP